MSNSAIDLVVVDDDEITLELVKQRLRRTCCHVTCFSDASDALNYLHENTPDVLIVDQRMPRFDGIELLRELGRSAPDRTYLWSSVPLPECLAIAAHKCRAIPICKDVLSGRSQLVELIGLTLAE